MLLPLICLFGVLSSIYAAPQVQLGKTVITGQDSPAFGLEFFGGIPFAEPPVGKLRFKPPVLKTRLDVKAFDASSFGKGCLQPSTNITQISEDCLTINVFRPAGIPPGAKLPVLFWTYGGSFVNGASFIYNASAIVAQSIVRGTPLIYVNYNYRLGPLGFPQGQEADDKKALNLALKDQLAALEWVQRNIGYFGGDKTEVTVFGESAGAIMTSILFLNSPLHRLARAAILESGSPGTIHAFRAKDREVYWQNFVSGVPSCAKLAISKRTFDCLARANSSEILLGINIAIAKSPTEFGFAPTLDGYKGLLPAVPSMLLPWGHFSRIPFIAGTNLDEGTAFTPTDVKQSTDVIRAKILQDNSPPLVPKHILAAVVDKLLRLYPDDPALGSPFNTGTERYDLPHGFKRAAAINGDLSFVSTRRNLQQTASRFGVKNFGYLFTQPQPNDPPFLGVTHASEVRFVYGVPTDQSLPALALSRSMIDYWISFATSLTPNDGKGVLPKGRNFSLSSLVLSQVLLQLNGLNLTTIPDTFRKEQIDFINSTPLAFYH
ncbi:hypothetical protein D9619_009956 [Psilocybe cf. subviscida]|uniref:Carboxylic ester hydrolase n=1 Tax=Psilocybe cf. subviscida TaxID=2480587 RepID=A0A8H5BKL5_9AGAR|nr:hypothetical protein D9619_009956 [Psilocybe cf. subviscida]